MNIKELKEIIKDLPDEMEIGSIGHFGEFLECWDCYVTKSSKKRFNNNGEYKDILYFGIESKGVEPE